MDQNFVKAELPLLSQKVMYQDRMITELKQDTKEFRQKVEAKIENLEEEIDELQGNQKEIAILLKQITETTKHVDKRIEDIATKFEKELGWKKIFGDVLKTIVTLLILLLTGKYINIF